MPTKKRRGRAALSRQPEPLDPRVDFDPLEKHYYAICGENIARLRLRRGLTQVELADMIGVQQPRVARIERGRMRIGVRAAARIAHALGVELGYLFSKHIEETPLDGRNVASLRKRARRRF